MDDNIRKIADQAKARNKDLLYFWKYEWYFHTDDLDIATWIEDGAPRLYGDD